MPSTEITSSITRNMAAKYVFQLVLIGASVFPSLLEAAPGGKTEVLPRQKPRLRQW